ADNQLFLKPTDAARELLPTIAEAPPYPGARPWLQLDEALDNPELLQRLLKATAAALPPPGATSRGRAAPGKSRAQGSSPGTRPLPSRGSADHTIDRRITSPRQNTLGAVRRAT